MVEFDALPIAPHYARARFMPYQGSRKILIHRVVPLNAVRGSGFQPVTKLCSLRVGEPLVHFTTVLGRLGDREDS